MKLYGVHRGRFAYTPCLQVAVGLGRVVLFGYSSKTARP